ncbi:MAG: D-Ala-D-Ala carboxypeptidase family metallohydrolase [Pseudomonadota bacterium]
MQSAIELDQKIHDAIAHNDADALQALLEELYQPAEASNRPFDAAIELKPSYREQLGGDGFESDAALNWANQIDRGLRRVAYNLKTAFGFTGTRIVSEGDSWFQYPLLLADVIDNFAEEPDFAVLSVGAAGDLVQHMAIRREYDAAIRETKTRIMLLSGGGNDLLGDGKLKLLLNPYFDGATATDLINKPALQTISGEILNYYAQILQDVLTNHPNVTVFGHGYDTPFPMQGEKYFGIPFEEAGIPLPLGREVVAEIVAFFRDQLSALAERFPNYRFIDLTGTVGDHPNSWKDELHPENAGFKRATQPMIAAVREHLATLPLDLGVESFGPESLFGDSLASDAGQGAANGSEAGPVSDSVGSGGEPAHHPGDHDHDSQGQDGFEDMCAAMLAENIAGPHGDDEANEDGEADAIHAEQAIAFEQLNDFPVEGLSILKRIFGPLKRRGYDYDTFAGHIERLDLRYFTPREFLFMGGSNEAGRCAGKNEAPPKELWDNIVPTALMLDEIRHRLGAPIRILSCYRSPAYNRCIGGASKSLHMQFRAVDWTCDGGSAAEWCRIAQEVRGIRSKFTGGVGQYDSSRFVHIDTRGYKADWRK